jgi:ABC-type enterobactin transport system permease subunit
MSHIYKVLAGTYQFEARQLRLTVPAFVGLWCAGRLAHVHLADAEVVQGQEVHDAADAMALSARHVDATPLSDSVADEPGTEIMSVMMMMVSLELLPGSRCRRPIQCRFCWRWFWRWW